MTETDELPEIFDDPRGKHDAAADIVDDALEIARPNAHPDYTVQYVELALEDRDDDDFDDIGLDALELAVNATNRALREHDGDA